MGTAPDPLVSQSGILLWISAVIMRDLVEIVRGGQTLASGIDDFHETHFVVDYELFSIRVFYCWIIGLRIGVSYRTRGENGRREKVRTSG